MKKIIGFLLMLIVFASCSQGAISHGCIEVQGHQFYQDNAPCYFVGTNYWYGSILASTGRGGDRERLISELDLMQKIGITNLRILSGAEGPDNEPYRVTPALQIESGVYNDTLLAGLDFLLNEMSIRKMTAVIYLNNTWEWSGGYAQYLNWSGYGDIPYPEIEPHTWSEFMNFSSQFHACDECCEKFHNYIRFMLSRTNRYNHRKYTEDPAIMTWEIANEPRALTVENKERFAQWIGETADFIKSIDPNHLVTTGTEGQHGCEDDMDLFKTIHDFSSIDYLTMHVWPKNWGWLNDDSIPQTVGNAIALTEEYMNKHIEIARLLDKPIIMEEFGLPRDHHLFSLEDSTYARDKYFAYIFNRVEKSAKDGDVLAGSNFWAFSGMGRHHDDDPFWKLGDDLMGDPPQEEQGLNSVFDTDNTIQLIDSHAVRLNAVDK